MNSLLPNTSVFTSNSKNINASTNAGYIQVGDTVHLKAQQNFTLTKCDPKPF